MNFMVINELMKTMIRSLLEAKTNDWEFALVFPETLRLDAYVAKI